MCVIQNTEYRERETDRQIEIGRERERDSLLHSENIVKHNDTIKITLNIYLVFKVGL